MKKKKMILSLAVLLGIMVIPMQTKAVLQANPNTNGKKTDTPTNWMTNIRKMETANQAMGLQETINDTTKKATSSSNGLDVHMIKTTEWGTVAILSASGYGNPKTLQASTIRSTTGNKSGVYFPANSWEWTAGGLSGYIFSGVDGKYYDAYTTSNTSAKAGDGLGTSGTANPGCAKWHGAPDANWIGSTHPYFGRGGTPLYNFGFNIDSWTGLSRAAVVCGAGF